MNSNKQDDLDDNGSLMSHIQVLIAPPASDDAAEEKGNAKSRDPGRSHACSTDKPICPECSKKKELAASEKCPQTDLGECCNKKRPKPNPMESSRKMNEPGNFPGTSKTQKRPRGRPPKPPPRAYELTPAGLVPVAAGNCFQCGRSSGVSVVLACDSCVRCTNLLFCPKAKRAPRKKITVPPATKNLYKDPIELLPSSRDMVRLNTALQQDQDQDQDTAGTNTMNQQQAKNSGQPHSITEATLAMDVVPPDSKRKADVGNEAPSEQADNTRLPRKQMNTERGLKEFDQRLTRLLAFQRIQHLLQSGSSTRSLATLIADSLNNFQPRHVPLPSDLLTPTDIETVSRVLTNPK